MHLSGFASLSLFILVAIFALIAVGALAALAFAMVKIQQLLTKMTDKLEPVVVKASDTLDTVHRVTVSVGEKADHILARGEVLTENVSHNVEKTAVAVQNAVTSPLINLSSLITGVSKGFSVWGRAATHGAHTATGDKAKVTKP